MALNASFINDNALKNLPFIDNVASNCGLVSNDLGAPDKVEVRAAVIGVSGSGKSAFVNGSLGLPIKPECLGVLFPETGCQCPNNLHAKEGSDPGGVTVEAQEYAREIEKDGKTFRLCLTDVAGAMRGEHTLSFTTQITKLIYEAWNRARPFHLILFFRTDPPPRLDPEDELLIRHFNNMGVPVILVYRTDDGEASLPLTRCMQQLRAEPNPLPVVDIVTIRSRNKYLEPSPVNYDRLALAVARAVKISRDALEGKTKGIGQDAKKRRLILLKKGRGIIATFVILATGTGAIPVPIVDAACLAAVNTSMVGALCLLYSVRIDDPKQLLWEVLKATAKGGAFAVLRSVAFGVCSVLADSLKVVPFLTPVGIVVDCALSGMLATAIGLRTLSALQALTERDHGDEKLLIKEIIIQSGLSKEEIEGRVQWNEAEDLGGKKEKEEEDSSTN